MTWKRMALGLAFAMTVACGAALVWDGAGTESLPATPIATTGPSTATAIYGSLPKGVILEGGAQGMDPVKQIRYDRGRNRFLINETHEYQSPVPPDTMKELLVGIGRDDRVGISLRLDGSPIIYGYFGRRSPVVQALTTADAFFQGVILARAENLEGVQLPGDYQPKAVEGGRTIYTAFYVKLDNYRFQKGAKEYTVGPHDLTIQLVPVKQEAAEDGGYQPDYEALEKNRLHEEDQANVAHIKKNRAAYEAMPPVAVAVRIGEGAAFVRHLRDSKINLRALAAQMR